jgi:hypothetical protein
MASSSRMSRLLEAVRLIEPEPSAPDLTVEASAPVAPVEAVALDASDELNIPEGVALETIYTQMSVPSAGFTIEKLSKLLDGLSQLDPETKKTMVRAMDSADDTWTIEDVVADARNKVGAIDSYSGQISELEAGITKEVERRVEASMAEKKAAIELIDEQAAKLEQQREAAIAESATAVAKLRAQGLAATETADRERRRLATTSKNYQSLVSLFNLSPAAPASNA